MLKKIFFIPFLIYMSILKVHLEQVANQFKFENCKVFNRFVEVIPLYTYSIVRIEGFSSFDDLKVKCITNIFQPIGLFKFIPKFKVSFDNSLNLATNRTFVSEYIKFNFAFIDSFSNCLNNFDDLIKNGHKISLFFSYSTLKLKSSTSCNGKKSASTFKDLFILSFLNNCKYNGLVDAEIFQNSKISSLKIAGLTNSIIKKNVLEFNEFKLELNSVIELVEFSFYSSSLNKKLLYHKIFKYVKIVSIKGRLETVDDEVFSNLTYLKEIRLQSSNNLYFFKRGLKFLNCLNSHSVNSKFNSAREMENLTINFRINGYNFPNEDFCIFKEFPKNKFILAIPDQDWKCSCTYFWLVDLYFYGYGKQIAEKNYICFNLNDSKLCKFDSMKRNCRSEDFYRNTKIDIDNLFVSEIFNFITVILIPFFCLFGIFSNLISIIVIQKSKLNKEKKLKFDLYEFMKLNSLINMIYSFIYIFHVVNVCIFVNGIHCPTFSRSILIQYYEIFLIDYVGGILKTSSNFLNLLVSYERYSSLNEKSFKIFKNKNIYIFIFILIISIVINSEKPLTSEVKRMDFEEIYGNLYPEYPLRNTFKGVFDSDLSHQSRTLKFKLQNPLYYGMFLFNFVTNDIIIFMLIVCSDMMLLFKFREKINQKKIILRRLFKNSSEKLSKAKISTLRFTAIILINTNVLLIFRMLEFSMNLLIVIQSRNEKQCGSIGKICSNYYHFGNFFYLITASCTIFVNYFFYGEFRENFRSIFFRFKKK